VDCERFDKRLDYTGLQALASSEIPYDCLILDLVTAQLTIATRSDRNEALASGFQVRLFFGLRPRLQQPGSNSRIPSDGLRMPMRVAGVKDSVMLGWFRSLVMYLQGHARLDD
jgi:hypothetical protein